MLDLFSYDLELSHRLCEYGCSPLFVGVVPLPVKQIVTLNQRDKSGKGSTRHEYWIEAGSSGSSSRW